MPRKPKVVSSAAAELRRRAELLTLERESEVAVPRTEVDAQRLLHELEVHQIELEMQNQELRLARAEAESLLEKYTDLYEFAPVGYFSVTPDGTIQQANLTGCTLVGTERSRLIGRPFAGLLSPALREGFHVFLQQAFLEPSKWSMEFEIHSPGQPPKPVSIEVKRTLDGKECRVMLLDISGRKREEESARRLAEKEAHHLQEITAATAALNRSLQAENLAQQQAALALQENEWRLRYATASAQLTYVEVDVPTGGARTAENFESVMGYAPQPDQEADAAAGNRLLLAHVVPEDRQRVATALAEFTSGNPLGQIDYRVLGDDGIERWIESRWSIERGPDGTAVKSFATNLDITERKQAEIALRESLEFNRSIIDSSPDCIKLLDLEGNLTAFLHGAPELLGIKDVSPYLNQPWLAFWEGADRQNVRNAIAAAVAGGEGNFVGFFRTLRDEPKWWDVKISPILDADGLPDRLLVVSRDVTERRNAELNLEFLASVSLDLVGLTDVEEMMAALGEKIGHHLGLSQCAFVEIDETAEQVLITHDWHRQDVPSLVGTHRLADFVEPEFIRLALAGETIVVRDTATDPRTTPEKFATLNIASFVCVPLIQHGQWRFAVCLYHSTAYAWRDDEIELMREMTVRIWTRLERLRAEEAMRRSEERYHTLFTSIDEGFCIIEMIYNSRKKPVDYRFLEVNSTFEKQTGLVGVTGKCVRELVPKLEQHWIDTYSRVALTGEASRFVNEVKAMGNRWFDVYVCRVGGAESRKVAVIFNDITERMRIEKQLAEKARLLDLSHDAIIVRDMVGHIRYWNHGAEEIYGWPREEVMGQISHVLLKTEFPESLEAMKEELFRTDRWIGELIHTKRDGQRITVLARKTLDRDAEGKPLAVLENITDITERKAAELALRNLAVLTASNQKLTEEIVHRQAVERDLHFTQVAQSLSLQKSVRLQEELRGMSHQVLQAQEEERKRISRELHDVVVQTLVGISVHVADLAQSAEGTPRSLQQKIAHTHRLVEKSVETVHQFARELRPGVLDDLGLIPALHAHLKEFMEKTGVRASLTAFAGIEKFPSPIRTAIYRISQEALVNVARHAHASHVEVSIQNLNGTVRLEITDNGKGFEVATISDPKTNKRLGLVGMKERAEMIGAVFTMESTPARSTTVRVDIPPTHPSATPPPTKPKSKILK